MKLLLTSIICGILFYPVFSQNSGGEIFDNSVLHEIRFEFSEEGFLDSLTNNFEYSSASSNVPYLMGKVTIDNQTVDSVGVRYKGYTSYIAGGENSVKQPVKIDFNEFVDGQRFDGLRKLNLNNGFGDPSMQRDAVCYDILRSMGVDAPRTSYAKVFFNGEYYGVYMIVEQVDKEFLQNNFSNDDGNLFKNMNWSNLEWSGNNSYPYDSIFNLKTNKEEADWSGFINLINVLNNIPDHQFKDSIQNVFNVDRYLKVLAVDVATGNWDSYLDHGRNWYLYEDTETDIFHWIPWDYNFALGGTFPENGISESISIFFLEEPAGSEKVLINKLLNVPEFKNKYLTYFCSLMQKFTSEKYNAFIEQNVALISEAFGEKPGGIYTYEQFLEDSGDSATGLKANLANHINFINSELNLLITCTDETVTVNFQDVVINELLASNDSMSNIADSNGEYDDWIELYNNSSEKLNLSGTYLSDNMSDLKQWQFPAGTEIESGGYLIVWADKDEGQSGLHANFKLKKSGDAVYFTNEDGSFIDSVSFGTQSTNIALARTPNGTGNFDKQNPTFSANNDMVTSTEELDSEEGFVNKVYPIPAFEQLNIDLKENNRNLIISIYSMHGQQLLEFEASQESGHVELNVSSLSKGFYVLRIGDSKTGKSEAHRFIIQ